MSAKKTLEILQTFTSLKKRKHTMSTKQYVKELHVLLKELDNHIENPALSSEEENLIRALLQRTISPKG